MKDYLLSIIKGERKGIEAFLVKGALKPLSYLYAAGLKTYLAPYRMGLRKQYRLPCPVISVGNISVGGTGKTSMTIRICEYLIDNQIKTCVLNRGYLGENENNAAIVSNGERIFLNARKAGDEAHLLASLLWNTPVLVGRDRRRTGMLAWEEFHPEAIVLDDGMQYYQLHRDLEIALVDATNPFGNGNVFPSGLLREPPSHLRRAQCVVITNADKVPSEELDRIRKRIIGITHRSKIYASCYQVECLRALDGSNTLPSTWLAGRRIASFCALGNPDNFEEQLNREGAIIKASLRLADHREPKMGDLQKLIAEAESNGAEGIVVSEKDAVKLPPISRPIPFYALIVRQILDDEDGFFALIRETVNGKRGSWNVEKRS
jgi:tetraacyldisaccharide 4'-kinase